MQRSWAKFSPIPGRFSLSSSGITESQAPLASNGRWLEHFRNSPGLRQAKRSCLTG